MSYLVPIVQGLGFGKRSGDDMELTALEACALACGATGYEVYARRPYDSDLLVAAIETHQALLGRVPRLVAADAAFYSAKNEV